MLRPGFDAPWQLSPPAPLAWSLWVRTRVNARGGLAIADNSLLWRTTDAAQSWQPVLLPADWERDTAPYGSTNPPPNTLPWYSSGLIDGQSMWVQRNVRLAAGARPLHLSFDGGRTWSDNAHPRPHTMMNFITDLARDRSGALLLNYGYGAAWHRSTDNGTTWRALPLALDDLNQQRIAQFLNFSGTGQVLAISSSGELFDSADGGRRWQRRPEAAQLKGFAPIRHVSNLPIEYLSDASDTQLLRTVAGTIWAVHDSRLYLSSDSGQRFESIEMTLPERLAPRRLVWAQGEQMLLEVWAPCRSDGAIYAGGWAPSCAAGLAASRDAGRTWQALPARWRDWSRVHFFNATDGVLADQRRVLRTRDGGQTWQEIYLNLELDAFQTPGFEDIHQPWLMPLRLVGMGNDGLLALFRETLYHSRDRGRSWVRVELPPSVLMSDMAFSDAENGWIVGKNGLLMSSRDGGHTWRIEDTGTTQFLSTVLGTPNNGSVWLGGAHNMIFMRAAGQR